MKSAPPSPTSAKAPRRGPWRFARPSPAAVFTLAVAGLLAVPLVAVLAAFAQPAGLVWDHVLGVLVPRYLATTLQLGVTVAVLATVFGAGAAWLVTMCAFPGRAVLEPLLMTPLALPSYVLAYVYLDMLGPAGPLAGLLAVDVASTGGASVLLAAALFPYVYVLARSAFLQRSGTFHDISRSLGVGPWPAFFRISLPLARPAVVAGAALVVMETLADFGAVSLLGVQTFTTGIYRAWFSMGDVTAAARLGGLLLLGVFALLVLERRARAGAAYHEARTARGRARFALTGWRAALAFGFCALPVLVGCVIPVARLVWLALRPGAWNTSVALGPLIANSAMVGTVTASIAVVLAVVMVYAARQSRENAAAVGVRAASLGYAVPGPVIAVGVLGPLAAVDGTIAGLLGELGLDVGLLLTGTVGALVFAYLVRFMTVSIGAIESGLAAVRPALDDAAATLGTGFAMRLWRVHVPLAWPALASAFLLVAVDVVKELPATLVLRPFDFDTLAVRTYNLVRDERLAEAAQPALVLVAIGLVPVLLLLRTLERPR
ncbi:MAG: ABC transporter permease [Alphaproteobacteria bacterium]